MSDPVCGDLLHLAEMIDCVACALPAGHAADHEATVSAWSKRGEGDRWSRKIEPDLFVVIRWRQRRQDDAKADSIPG